MRSKNKVLDQVYLVKDLPHQVLLVIYSLGQLVNYKIKVYLTSWNEMRELCGAQLYTGWGFIGGVRVSICLVQ